MPTVYLYITLSLSSLIPRCHYWHVFQNKIMNVTWWKLINSSRGLGSSRLFVQIPGKNKWEVEGMEQVASTPFTLVWLISGNCCRQHLSYWAWARYRFQVFPNKAEWLCRKAQELGHISSSAVSVISPLHFVFIKFDRHLSFQVSPSESFTCSWLDSV